MRRRGDIRPVKRAGTWYLKRRVPKEFAHLDRRDPVRLSTEIAVVDDPRGVRARRVVEQLNMQLEAYWRGLRDGQSAEAKARFEAAQKGARALGVKLIGTVSSPQISSASGWRSAAASGAAMARRA